MPAKFNGKCFDCGAKILEGQQMDYRGGKAHCIACSMNMPNEERFEPYGAPDAAKPARKTASEMHFVSFDDALLTRWSELRMEEYEKRTAS